MNIEELDAQLQTLESATASHIAELREEIGGTGDGLTEEQVRLDDALKGLSCRFCMMEDAIKQLRLDVGGPDRPVAQESKVSLHDLGTDLLVRVEALEAMVQS